MRIFMRLLFVTAFATVIPVAGGWPHFFCLFCVAGAATVRKSINIMAFPIGLNNKIYSNDVSIERVPGRRTSESRAEMQIADAVNDGRARRQSSSVKCIK